MNQAAMPRALTYVQANLNGDVSLDVLAAAANCSPPYFSRRSTQLMAE
jgi:AraC-like DNA-binding protein